MNMWKQEIFLHLPKKIMIILILILKFYIINMLYNLMIIKNKKIKNIYKIYFIFKINKHIY